MSAVRPRPVEPVAAFDVCGPLPTGVTVLEASAGTGKTFTIAALAARYVAEGTPLDRLLVVTFTRMATGELRDRVRERLVRTEQGLARMLAGALFDDDEVVGLLADAAPAEVALRRSRLAGALADFDAATIATTHEFCLHVLSGLGVVGDVDQDVTFVEDPRELVDEVVADFYVRKFQAGAHPPFDVVEARRIAYLAVRNHDAALEPVGAPPGSAPDLRRRLAVAVRSEVDRRRRRVAVLTYDDLLTRLRATLADPVRGQAACRRLRDRYRVALVDEFQDTDPVQWEIMRRAFGDGSATLVLIGDPKQAIYAFRGADVYAYLQAAEQAGSRATLSVNWRSDQALLDAYDALFGGAKLGHPGIAYRRVEAAAAKEGSRFFGGTAGAALRVRVVHRAHSLVGLTPKGFLSAKGAREHVAADLAADVVRLVSPASPDTAAAATTTAATTTVVRPGHVAVLVPRNRDAVLVREALEAVGVPAVINGAGSVFATPAATEWLRFLEALERPTASGPAHAAALTVFLGWGADRVATAGDDDWEHVHARLLRWAGVLRRRGVAALFETVAHTEGLAARMLARVDGERRLTDVRHVGQLLHAASMSGQLGITALTDWLRQRLAGVASEGDAEDRARRLESDAEAVQVLTIHRSKGLEFPVVYCPYLWDPGWIDPLEPPVYHDSGAGDRRTIDVGGPGSVSYARHVGQRYAESRGEELRLAYVALTRARHRAVIWWAATFDSRESALCRLLFSRDADGNAVLSRQEPPEDEEVEARLRELAQAAPGCISVERSDGGDGRVWSGDSRPVGDLRTGRFTRTLDLRWRRTSYSAITAGAHEAAALVGSEPEPEEAVVVDEGLAPGPSAGGGAMYGGGGAGAGAGDAGEAGLRTVPSLLAAMPGGVGPGTFVHQVLEGLDFAADDLDADLASCIDRERARSHTDIGDPALLATGLRAAIDTPLGPLMGDIRLRDIATGDRIDELAFELPLVGGDTPTGEVAVAQLGDLLAEYLPPDDVLAGYARHLGDPSLQEALRGYLSGSLDLVFRVRTAAGVPRFAVVDYKTNRLGTDTETLSAWDYRPAALTEAMYRSHYPLQALLYTAALHRYLRWRLPGYRAEVNLAGVLYLFVRGMTGPGTPRVEGQPCGVFSWRPPPALVEALSDLLDRGAAGR